MHNKKTTTTKKTGILLLQPYVLIKYRGKFLIGTSKSYANPYYIPFNVSNN